MHSYGFLKSQQNLKKHQNKGVCAKAFFTARQKPIFFREIESLFLYFASFCFDNDFRMLERALTYAYVRSDF